MSEDDPDTNGGGGMGGDNPFDYEHGPFDERSPAPGVDLSQREADYGEIVAEIIWDGVITQNDRLRLTHAAGLLGLTPERTQQIEKALRAAYEARHRVRVVEQDMDDAETADQLGFIASQRVSVTDLDIRLRPSTDGPTQDHDPTEPDRASGRGSADTISPLAHGQDPVLEVLEGRIRYLEAKNAELEQALALAREEIVASQATHAVSRDPTVLHARFVAAPADPTPLHEMFRTLRRAADLDRRWRVAHALAFLGATTEEERRFSSSHSAPSPIKPHQPVSREIWRSFVRHPDEDELPGDIFAVIAPAVLLSQIAAIRGVAKLPAPPTTGRIDPRQDKTPAVRCVTWAAAILGIATPPIYLEPNHPSLVEIIPGAPSGVRLGERALSPDRNPKQLAFALGRHLSTHRPEHFVAALVASPRELDDLFLAALTIGNPGLPMDEAKKARVLPIARSIDPLLSDEDRAKLRAHFLRFVELGGKTNLRQWAAGRDLTASTAGLLLANDLDAAWAMLAHERPERADERMQQLLALWTGSRFGELREAMGVALVEQ